MDIEGTWDGETLTLVEDFVYDDGETERRTWTIRKIDEHTYEGSSPDGVIGTALMKSYGNAVNFSYDFGLRLGDRTLRVRFTDWMWLQDENRHDQPGHGSPSSASNWEKRRSSFAASPPRPKPAAMGPATTKRASRRSSRPKPHAIVRDGNLSFRLRLPSIQSSNA